MTYQELKERITKALYDMDNFAIAKELADNIINSYYAKTFISYNCHSDRIEVYSLTSNTFIDDGYIINLEMFRYTPLSDFDCGYDDSILDDFEWDQYNDTIKTEIDMDYEKFLGHDEWSNRIVDYYKNTLIDEFETYRIQGYIDNLDEILNNHGIYED